MTAVLAAHGISVSFGGVRAVVDVSLEVRPGQLVGLIGPNGAGKTTFIDAVTGFVPHGGTVSIDGKDVTRLAPHARARCGLARTWQATELFDDLSVRENLTVAARHPTALETTKELLWRSVGDVDAVDEALDRLSLDGLADALPGELTQGQRKMVSVARALAARPKLLLLDEPAAGLDARESAALGGKLREVVDQGLPVLLVDHDMGLVLGISDQLVVIESGVVIASGTPGEIRQNPRVVEAYLGAADRLSADSPAASRVVTVQPVLSIEGLTAGYDGAPVLRNVDLHVDAGEVVALLGPNGAGKTTALRTISGLVRPFAGTIRLDGEDLAAPLTGRPRPSRHRPHARGSRRLLRSHGRRALPARVPGRAARQRHRLRLLPRLGCPGRSSRGPAVRRRAADARARPRVGAQAAADVARRTVAGPGTGDRRRPPPDRVELRHGKAAAPCCSSSSTSTSR